MSSLAAFDSIASTYDGEFTATTLGGLLRARVRPRLEQLARGARVLELGCGTGADAIWLAQRGIHVTATDISPTMLAHTRAKSELAHVSALVQTRLLDLNDPHLEDSESFTYAFSNFGALNCLADLHPLARWLAKVVRERLILVVMGPLCLWEVAANIARGDAKRAFRRFRPGGTLARVNGNPVVVFYPSPRALSRAFAPMFQVIRVEAIGVLLPPPYLTGFAARHPRFIKFAARIEPCFASWFPFNNLGDHYLIELERR